MKSQLWITQDWILVHKKKEKSPNFVLFFKQCISNVILSCCVNAHMCFQGDFTWNSALGYNVSLKAVPLQSLSELERVRLQDVAFRRLLQCHDPGCHITIPKCTFSSSKIPIHSCALLREVQRWIRIYVFWHFLHYLAVRIALSSF